MSNKTVLLLIYVLAFANLSSILVIHPVVAGTIVVPDDYSTIQEAVSAADEGDTVIVRSGTYIEDIVIFESSISLIGEDPLSTIINGQVTLYSNSCSFIGFTVTYDGSYSIGIYVTNWGNTISGNRIVSCDAGIDILGSDNTISGNYIAENAQGIVINHDEFWGGWNNVFVENDIVDNQYGVFLNGGMMVTVEPQDRGKVASEGSEYSEKFYHNNFVNNTCHVFMPADSMESYLWDYGSEGNYWSDYQGMDWGGDGIGDTPYIVNSHNVDHYPFVSQSGWKSTKLSFSLSPYPAYVGQTITLLGTLADRVGRPLANKKIDLYVNGTLAGTIFTNQSGWFQASAKVNAAGAYSITAFYSGSQNYNPSNNKATLVVHLASIRIWTDRTEYDVGDTMEVHIRVRNGGSTLAVRVVVALRLPNENLYPVLNTTTTLPANYDSGDVLWKTFTIPGPVSYYDWVAELRNPKTGQLVSQSTWHWYLTPA